MEARQEYDIDQAQADLESVALPWAYDHTGPGSRIEVMPPDLDNKPWQSVDEFVSPAQPLPNFVPEKLILMYLRYKLVPALGGSAIKLSGWQAANKLVRDFRTPPAFADQPNGPRLAEQMATDIAAGENNAIVCAHQILNDLGIAAGGSVAATSQTKYITEANFIPLSPTMKFEGIDGKDLYRLIRPVANCVWVWPQTPSASKRDIPRRLFLRSNRGSSKAMGPILNDPAKGTIMYEALTGSRMVAIEDKESKDKKIIGWEFPQVFPSSASALRLTHRALPFAFYTNPENGKSSWEVGSFINRSEIEGDSEQEIDQRFMDKVMLDLQQRMQRLAGVPVKYQRLIPSEQDIQA